MKKLLLIRNMSVLPVTVENYHAYKNLIHLNDVERMATTVYHPITLPRQLAFSSPDQVRKYIIESTRRPNEEDNPVAMMAVMMEAYFGHYSTCMLNHEELVNMWARLFTSAVNRLYDQSINTVPLNMRKDLVVSNYRFDGYIEELRTRVKEKVNASTTKKNERERFKKEELNYFANYYRTRKEIVELMTKFSFNMGSRFFVLPIHRRAIDVQSYMSLRDEIVDKWCEVGVDALMTVNPYRWFTVQDPKSVVFETFPPDAEYDMEMLGIKKRKFITWLNREKRHRLKVAKDTDDFDYAQAVEQEFKEAIKYFNIMSKALEPRAKRLTQEEKSFIVDDTSNSDSEIDENDLESTRKEDHEYVSDSEVEEDTDNDYIRQQDQLLLSKFKHIKDIEDDEEDEVSDEDEYQRRVEEKLAKLDQATREKQRKFKQFEEMAEEGGSDEEDENDTKMIDDDDDGSSYAEDDEDGDSYMTSVNMRLDAAETGAIVYKVVNGKKYGITGHAYGRGHERRVSERDMLVAAHKGEHIGNNHYSDGKTTVLMSNDGVILTAFPESRRNDFVDVPVPNYVHPDKVPVRFPIRYTKLNI